MTGPTKRELRDRLEDLEDDVDDGERYTVTIQHFGVDEGKDGEPVVVDANGDCVDEIGEGAKPVRQLEIDVNSCGQ